MKQPISLQIQAKYLRHTFQDMWDIFQGSSQKISMPKHTEKSLKIVIKETLTKEYNFLTILNTPQPPKKPMSTLIISKNMKLQKVKSVESK